MKKLFISLIILLSLSGTAFASEDTYYCAINGVYGQMNQSQMAVPDGVVNYGLGVDGKAFFTDLIGFSCGVNYDIMNIFSTETNNLFIIDFYLGVPFKLFDNDSFLFMVTPSFGFNIFSNDILGFFGITDSSLDVDSISIWCGAEVSAALMITDDFGFSIADQIEYRFAGFGEYKPFEQMNRWANQIKFGFIFKI